MGLCYEFGHGTEKNLKKAVEFYEEAVTKGSVSAMLNLGVLYCENKDGYGNPSRGLELVRKAAEGGKASAMYNLYLYYRYGRGVTQIDEKQAHYWLDKAAEKGHAKAKLMQKSWQ
jgi:TPR repeat protein